MPRRASSLWIHVVSERYWSGGWAYAAAAAVIAIGVWLCASSSLRRLHCACRLLIATVLDVGMGLLLIGVTGFILQGVNNTGPMMPEAVLFCADDSALCRRPIGGVVSSGASRSAGGACDRLFASD